MRRADSIRDRAQCESRRTQHKRKGEAMSNLYAIETEMHSDSTITHLIAYGRQVEGRWGAWYADCGRVVRGEVWEAGSVEGGRCKNCVAKTLQRQKWEDERKARQEKSLA